ncbi:hydrolase, HAD-super, subfamily IIIA domain protein [Agrilactobacillus composti DSM 18527 = JCM 14202]|uniref:Hydrolase, HAD-super, subfamily IIIA domain protein n=1 Tax=Agrilactobacillus composti DSM 18527 = JCM 14202 TaxID=1423734 RepID=X0PR95_9LACO|nr:YqeG family HAD IIIA-type phosphatase [Agrilactobacillus composti]KRM35787.1 hydrolase, HAD-super, subfamily IIIA domain protein [Agrilactobacillus composti DSM 18527 = JCM 14202]GAF39651.1 hydrolase [Agrilactobacillus composti DSM 18527 = JCM 14202]
MLKSFKPTFMLNSLYDLDPDQLKTVGIRNILTDLDNTLLPWNNKLADAKTNAWLQKMRQANIQVIVVSNNSHARVGMALEQLEMPFVARAMKPTVKGIREALTTYQLLPAETVMVGDQLITDVYSGNRAGLRTILVKPLVTSDGWNTSINRFIEQYIFKYLKKHFVGLDWQSSLTPAANQKR